MKWFILLLLLGSVACSQMSKQDAKVEGENAELNSLSFEVRKEVLPNGLTVLLVENKKLPIFTYYTFYKVGGKFETQGITGASHFLEHMMFKGAKKYGYGVFDQLVEGNGGRNNAYTSNDLTVYYQDLPSEHVYTMIDLEADRMENLLLKPEAFESERLVVLEERKMRYENSDRGKLYLNMMQEMFVNTPYGTSVIGNIEDLKSVSRDQIYDYFKKYYAPNNAVIVIVGDINSKKVMKEIKAKFGSIPASEKLDELKAQTLEASGFNFQGKYNRNIHLKGTSTTPMFFFAFQGVKVGEKDAYSLDILSSVLGDGQSSYLHQKYVASTKPILTNVFASNYTMQDSGVFFLGGQLIKGENRDWIKGNLLKQIKQICNGEISDRSLQKIKNQYLVHMISGLESNSGVAQFLGNREVYYNDYNFYKKEMDLYNAVTKEDLIDVCNRYLQKDKSLYLTIWNKN